MTQEFKFYPGQQILTPFSEKGIVEYCAINKNGKEPVYSVQTKKGSDWYDESSLSPINE